MVDQAENLRSLIEKKIKKERETVEKPAENHCVISIISSNGGVGKSVISVNLALMLAKKHFSILLVEMETMHPDIHGYIDAPGCGDWMKNMKEGNSLESIIQNYTDNCHTLLSDEISWPANIISAEEVNRFFLEIKNLKREMDYIVLDVGMGAGGNISDILERSDEIFFVITTDKHVLSNTYKMIKTMKNIDINKPLNIIVNKCSTLLGGRKIYKQLEKTSSKYLGTTLNLAGLILKDDKIKSSIDEKKPFVIHAPAARPTLSIEQMLKSKPFCIIKNNEKTLAEK